MISTAGDTTSRTSEIRPDTASRSGCCVTRLPYYIANTRNGWKSDSACSWRARTHTHRDTHKLCGNLGEGFLFRSDAYRIPKILSIFRVHPFTRYKKHGRCLAHTHMSSEKSEESVTVDRCVLSAGNAFCSLVAAPPLNSTYNLQSKGHRQHLASVSFP